MKIPLLIGPIFATCLFLAIPNNIQAPGSQDLRRLYGEPTMERFAARSGITVTVEYGPGRLACQVLIEPQQMLVEVKNQGLPMPSEAVFKILEEVVPVGMRGKEIGTDRLELEGNQILRTEYENVSIRRFCTLNACGPPTQNQDLRTLVVFKRESCPKHLE